MNKNIYKQPCGQALGKHRCKLACPRPFKVLNLWKEALVFEGPLILVMPVLGLHIELNILENEAPPSSMLVATLKPYLRFSMSALSLYSHSRLHLIPYYLWSFHNSPASWASDVLWFLPQKISVLFILQSKLWLRTKVEVGWHTHNHPLIIWNMRLCSSAKLAQQADCGHVLGKADPYVVLKAGGATAKSSTCKGNP